MKAAQQLSIDAELTRIGADYSALGPCSSVVALVGPDEASGVPDGYVTYYDDTARGWAKSDVFLAALRALPDNYCRDCDGTDFWESFPDLSEAERRAAGIFW